MSFSLQGLRAAVLIGIAGTCLGAWIKVASVSPDRFWVAFLGQSVVALSQIFILSIPARLAAVWFGPEQVSSACSIGVFGNQVRTVTIKLKSSRNAIIPQIIPALDRFMARSCQETVQLFLDSIYCCC